MMVDSQSSTSAAASGGAVLAGKAPMEAGIDVMLESLGLTDDDFDDLLIEADDPAIAEATRWMAVARVVCGKGFSHDALFNQMQIAWNPAREVKMRAVGDNLFVIQCFCLGDWEKVTTRGPWLFRDWALLIAPYDGFSDPYSVELEFMPIWLQVHKIPEGFRKKEVIEKLVSRTAGEVTAIEMIPVGVFRGDYVRLRVNHDVRRPLARFVSISMGGRGFHSLSNMRSWDNSAMLVV
jgi:hypothetical protein